MKKILIAIVLATAAVLAGCASNPPKVAAPPVPVEPPMSKWESFATAIAAAKDSASQVAIAMAFATEGGRAPPVVQQEQSLTGILFQAALQAGDLFLRGYGIKATRDVGIVQSNNQAATTMASYAAFSAMGGSIERAGVAGYPFVQAPAPNVTTNLSGTGVIGSGTYTGPVTRTCTGGPAGNGAGTASGGAGGAGGPANC